MSIMAFVHWFRSEPHRAKYGVDHPAFLAAKETWDYQQARIEALESENKDLLAACEQKQEIINALKTELEDTVTECMAEKSNNDIRQDRIDALEKAAFHFYQMWLEGSVEDEYEAAKPLAALLEVE